MDKKKETIQSSQNRQLKDVDQLFVNMGFECIATEFKIKDFQGNVLTDIDKIYVCNSNIIICVELTVTKEVIEHFRKKVDIYHSLLQTEESKHEFLIKILRDTNWSNKFDLDKNKLEQVKNNKRLSKKYVIRFLYIYNKQDKNIHQKLIDILVSKKGDANIKLFNNRLLNYFLKISKIIQKSARYEFFSFIGVTYQFYFNKKASSCSEHIVIKNNGVMFPQLMSSCEVVIFTMSPEELIRQASIHRKNGWREDNYLYQRFIIQKKINEIRKDLISKKMIFINSIIVSLPDTTEVSEFNLKDSNQSEDDSKLFIMKLPENFDNINIIDGQHRLFSHYESLKDDNIIQQRESNELFVTGIIFDSAISDIKKRQIEASIFVEINSKQKNIENVLLKEIRKALFPNTIEALSVKVIDKLNNSPSSLFEKLLPSPRDFVSNKSNTIERTSIIDYGLMRLLKTKSKKNIFIVNLWNCHQNDQKLITLETILNDSTYREEFSGFLYNNLDVFFKSLKSISEQNKDQASYTFDKNNHNSVYVLTYFWVTAFILLFRDILVGQYEELAKIIVKDNYQSELRQFYMTKLKDLANNKELFSVSSSGSKYANVAKNIYEKYFKVKITN